MTKKIIIIISVAVLLSVLVIIFPKNPSSIQAASPNIVLIVMDTARHDHCSFHGYEKKTTPILEELSKNSTIFHDAYTPAGWTSPAHASLFTGLFPISHGVSQENWICGDDLTTLAEILRDRGYETVGIVENPVLASPNNFDQGFQMYHETWKIKKKNQNTACEIFKEFVPNRNKNKPFFVFFNFIEPHSPYNSSGPFYDTFISDPSIKLEHNMWIEYFLNKVNFSNSQIKHLFELYDAEILYTDYLIGQVIYTLKNYDLWNDTVFIVTSDHGENIGDHNMMDHVFSLHESIIKIPLLIHYPKSFALGHHDFSPTLLIDIFPTLLKLCGIDINRFDYHGVSLVNSERKNRKIFAEYYYPKQALELFPDDEKNHKRLEKYKRRIKAVIEGKFKLIWGSDGNHALYNLKEDPNEEKNLVNNDFYKNQKQLLLESLQDFVKKYHSNRNRSTKNSLKEMDKKTLEELKSLGYIK
jgi:arylsulfatase A-like enzyme